MDIENIVYLLIGLVWLVVGAYKKLNKPVQANAPSKTEPKPSTSSERRGSGSDFEEIFRKMLEGDMSMGKRLDETVEYEEEETGSRVDEIDTQAKQEEKLDDSVQKNIIKDKQVKVKHKVNNRSVFKSGFNAREAFIYSEIMKRPDY